MIRAASIACLLGTAALGGCVTSKYAVVPTTSGAMCLLQPFVTNADGSLTKAQLDAGVTARFKAADMNGNGNLEFAELDAVNTARARTCDQTSLVDWSGKGQVRMADFGARYYTAFEMSDIDGNGVATHDEILYAKPKPPKQKKAPMKPDDSSRTDTGAGQAGGGYP